MTTHTDRKSAEILAALDKLAENGMPFVDVVKQGGFAGFLAKGAHALPTEPVQVHEDPGAAYWKEATKMAEHTDQIRQMAQEAGIQSPVEYDGHSTDCPWMATTDELTRFAQLVAEDCARVVEPSDEHRLHPHEYLGAEDGLQMLDNLAESIRARYSLKD